MKPSFGQIKRFEARQQAVFPTKRDKVRPYPWNTVIKGGGEPLKFQPTQKWVNRDRSSN